MVLIDRQKDSRRFAQTAEFPLTDNHGIPVIRDRRRLPDRRKVKPSLIDMMVILSKKTID